MWRCHRTDLFLKEISLLLATYFFTKNKRKMEEPKAKIERIIAEGINFKFGDYISQGFDIFKKEAGLFIGFTAVFFVVSMVIGLIPALGSVANQLIISPVALVGIYLVSRKLDIGEQVEFGDFFKGFDFVKQLALAALVIGLIVLVTLIPFGLMVWKQGWGEWYMDILQNPSTPPADHPELPPVWTYLLLLPAMFLGTCYTWTYLFIINFQMDFWNAMEASRKILTKIWPIYFLFLVVVWFIFVGGILLLCLGILATFPLMYCMMYAAFADVTKLNEIPNEGAGIEEHLIE